MIAADINITYQAKPLDFAAPSAAVNRTGGNIEWPNNAKNPSSSYEARLVGSATSQPRIVLTYRGSAWFTSAINAISEFRNVRDGWDGVDAPAPQWDALDTAEMLAVFFNNLDHHPSFGIDALGRPTFSINSDDLYLHLTVDQANQITWFAEAGGVEHFEEGVEFTGRKLPEPLAALL